MKKILTPSFFSQPTLTVAQELLGKFLVENIGGTPQAHFITEVEAYDGPLDQASHAHRGKTLRNSPMFGPPGVWYVYLCYGLHSMLNIVTGPEEFPAAVLIRGIIHSDGRVLNGPAKLTKALGIDKKFNNLKATKSSQLWIEDHGIQIPQNKIHRSSRIGVDYAGDWAKKPYRFFL